MKPASPAKMSARLRLLVPLAAVLAALLFFALAPWVGRTAVRLYPALSFMFWPTLLCIWVTAIPVACGLLRLWQIGKATAAERECRGLWADIFWLSATDAFLYAVSVAVLLRLELLRPAILLLALAIVAVFVLTAYYAAKRSRPQAVDKV